MKVPAHITHMDDNMQLLHQLTGKHTQGTDSISMQLIVFITFTELSVCLGTGYFSTVSRQQLIVLYPINIRGFGSPSRAHMQQSAGVFGSEPYATKTHMFHRTCPHGVA